MKKKTLSLALALAVCLGLLPTALAAPAAIATVKASEIVFNTGDDSQAVIVQSGGKYGAYKLDGTQLAAPEYAYAKSYSDGMAAVTKEGSMQVIFDWEFDEEQQKEYGDDGKIWEFEDGKYGYLDESGKLAIPMKYEKAFDFSEDRAFVRETEDGPLLMIDKTGKVIASYDNVDLWYYETVKFSEGLAIIPLADGENYAESTHYIAVDKSGKTVYSYMDQYVDFENGYQNGLVAVAEQAEWGTGGPCLERGVNGMGGAGYRDKTGKKVISGDYDELGAFSDGMAMVAKYDDDWNWKCGFINTNGDLVVPMEYTTYWSFDNGIGAVSKGSGEDAAGALVDKNGKFLTDFLYSSIWGAEDGLVPVRTASGVITVLDSSTGKTVFTTKDGKTGSPVLGGLMCAVSEAGKGTVYDAKGSVVPTVAFSDFLISDGGFLWLKSGDAYHVYRSADLAASGSEPEAPSDTSDYQVSNWAKDRVALAVEAGLAPEGLGNDYRVDITRAQFAAVSLKLYEAMSGKKAPAASENPFTDTTDPVILQAADLGFVSGVGGGKFDPDALVNREQAAVMLSSVYTKLGGSIPTVEAASFDDNGDMAAWARNAVAFMNDKGIVTGIGGNNFGPKGSASIEQALLISLKMFETLK